MKITIERFQRSNLPYRRVSKGTNCSRRLAEAGMTATQLPNNISAQKARALTIKECEKFQCARCGGGNDLMYYSTPLSGPAGYLCRDCDGRNKGRHP